MARGPNPAFLFSYRPQAKNVFYTFKWLKKIKEEKFPDR